MAGKTIALQAQLDAIKTNYNINGPGYSTLTVNGNNNAGTIFTVNAGVTSTISGLTISGGSGANGGGIFNSGDLTLYSDVISGNKTAGSGAGIYNNVGAQLQVQTVSIIGNTAGKAGGGLENYGTVTICCGSMFTLNGASIGGGAIQNGIGGTIDAFDNTKIFTNNDSFVGAGVSNAGTFTMQGGSIYNNEELGTGIG